MSASRKPEPASSPARRPRADARRNYERLLAAAEKAFNAQGAEASLDDIARAAGVGNATLYRHFPTRQHLIEAVYDDRVQALCAKAEELAASQPAGAALLAWLHAIVRHVTGNRGLRDAFHAAYQLPSETKAPQATEWHRQLRVVAVPLLRAAQANGTVRPDLTVEEVLVLTGSIANAGDPAHADRLLTLVIEGLTRS